MACHKHCTYTHHTLRHHLLPLSCWRQAQHGGRATGVACSCFPHLRCGMLHLAHTVYTRHGYDAARGWNRWGVLQCPRGIQDFDMPSARTILPTPLCAVPVLPALLFPTPSVPGGQWLLTTGDRLGGNAPTHWSGSSKPLRPHRICSAIVLLMHLPIASPVYHCDMVVMGTGAQHCQCHSTVGGTCAPPTPSHCPEVCPYHHMGVAADSVPQTVEHSATHMAHRFFARVGDAPRSCLPSHTGPAAARISLAAAHTRQFIDSLGCLCSK